MFTISDWDINNMPVSLKIKVVISDEICASVD